MPPKSKFTREEVIEAALSILRAKGRSALTARALGERLNSSARPIFTLFSGMDEILKETEQAARRVYGEYVSAGLKEKLPFKGVGRSYLRFAREEPKLYQYLFMREAQGLRADLLREIDDNFAVILQSVTDGYGLDAKSAERLYFHLWIYTQGIASLIASRTCAFTEEETDEMLTEAFIGFLMKAKGGQK